MNRRLSTGTIGVFGIGISQSGVVDPSALPQRQRGREVDGGILDNRRNLGREKDALALRISAALGVDRTRRVLNFNGESPISTEANNRGGLPGDPGHGSSSGKLWESVMGLGMYRRCVCSGRGWPWSADAVADEDGSPKPPSTSKTNRRSVPATPFRVLDAPGLRDDYYCSLIAYSPSSHTLAVGLHSDVYSWEEETGARSLAHWSNAHVTSLAFSSAQGNNDILAIGRINGSLSLWAPAEVRPRLNQRHSSGVACIAWKPKVTPRKRTDNRPVVLEAGVGYTEDLLVGDEAGNVYLYTVEWGRWDHDLRLDPPNAMMTLMRRIVVHSQQICGLAWSWDGSQFVTGGNDNVAFLYVTSEVMGARSQFGLMEPSPQIVLYGNEKHRWQHSAAVKAIAFCPWQKTLVATGTYRAPPPPPIQPSHSQPPGGGSNDRCIHFFHTGSGADLGTINVAAQVTSLLWSHNHREIAATLGYANPDHAVRIVVYSWPQCQQVLQVPWQEDMRALYAVAYPGGPSVSEGSRIRADDDDSDDGDDEGERLLRELGAREPRRKEKRQPEGCIVVTASDETVRFHEVWGGDRRAVTQRQGVLGGSAILEGLEGIEGEGDETIR